MPAGESGPNFEEQWAEQRRQETIKRLCAKGMTERNARILADFRARKQRMPR